MSTESDRPTFKIIVGVQKTTVSESDPTHPRTKPPLADPPTHPPAPSPLTDKTYYPLLGSSVDPPPVPSPTSTETDLTRVVGNPNQTTASDGDPTTSPTQPLFTDLPTFPPVNPPVNPPAPSPPTDHPSHYSPIGLSTDSALNSPVPSPTVRVLTESDLSTLVSLIGNAAHYAYNLGVQLDLGYDLILCLERQAMGDQFKFLDLVLSTRLKCTTPPATLQVLVDAISQPPISDEALGLKILEHFK